MVESILILEAILREDLPLDIEINHRQDPLGRRFLRVCAPLRDSTSTPRSHITYIDFNIWVVEDIYIIRKLNHPNVLIELSLYDPECFKKCLRFFAYHCVK